MRQYCIAGAAAIAATLVLINVCLIAGSPARPVWTSILHLM